MSDDEGVFRAAGSWDEVAPPRLEERVLPALVPWGLGDAELGDAEPAREVERESGDAYLCVACWEWHCEATTVACEADRRAA